MSGPVPRTVFNAPLTERRAVAFASIPLADMKTVNNAFGGSITNVFLAACTLSLRAWLQRHDAVPDGPLLMQVPLSLPDADSTTVDNQFTRAYPHPGAARRPRAGPDRPPCRHRKA
jgi:diacylglycerol O-acyltransferase